MKFSEKYKSLFKNEYENIRYIIVTGSRASGKSTAVSNFLHDLSFQKENTILITRFTGASASTSIIPAFTSTISKRKSDSFFEVQRSIIYNKYSKSKIHFAGLKSGSKEQTAKLKSFENLNIWVLDEAEELHDEMTFDDIDDSIRSKNKQNLVILILNTYRITTSHFIYRRFFKDKNIPNVWNGEKDNILYIHTTFEDNIKNLSESFLQKVAETKKTDPEKYESVYLGIFKDSVDGSLFPKTKLNFFKGKLQNNYIGTLAFIDTAGAGTDNYSMPVGRVFYHKGEYYIYIDKVIYDKSDIDITEARAVNLCNKMRPDQIVYEVNQYGTLGLNSFKNKVYSPVSPNRATQNKHGRIIAQSDFIIKYVYFRSDYIHGSEYQKFMYDIYNYLKTGKQTTHDDAPDSLSGLMTLFRLKYNM